MQKVVIIEKGQGPELSYGPDMHLESNDSIDSSILILKWWDKAEIQIPITKNKLNIDQSILPEGFELKLLE